MSRTTSIPTTPPPFPVLPEDGQSGRPDGKKRSHSPQKNSPSVTKKRTNGRTKRHKSRISAGQSPKRAGDSLGSPASVSESDADSALSDAPTDAPIDYSAFDVPGADPDDSTPPVVVVSTPEHVAAAIAFFEARKEDESAQQVDRARAKSRVWSLMQYRCHPKSGEPMFSQEQLDAGLRELGDRVYRFAYIWHDSDRLVLVDEGTTDVVCCGLKGLHCHLVLWTTEDRPTRRTVSDAFTIPSARVRTPKEVAAQEGTDDHKGRNAAEKAFFDLAEYLTHETRGKDGLRGTTQPERFYLVDKDQPGKPGKYQYSRGRVVANFDFGHALDVHMAGRPNAVAAEGGTSLTRRKRLLRRLVNEGTTVRECKELDLDAALDDLPRLQAIERSYIEEHSADPTLPELGSSWHKGLVVVTGPKGAGKDVIAQEIAIQAVEVASLAGRLWTVAKPPGRNALEGLVGHEVVHHEDLRGQAFPSYDEALRYLNNHACSEVFKRHSRLPQVFAPRVILATTTETASSLGLTMLTHKSSAELARIEAERKGVYPALDIDEFLRRIGWVLDVRLPAGLSFDGLELPEQLALVRREVMASIYRPRMDAPRRKEVVTSRLGDPLGTISTTHELELIGALRGAVDIARFVVVSIMAERNTDVVSDIPVDVWETWLTAKAMAEQMTADDTDTVEIEGEVVDESGPTAEELQAELDRVAASVERQRLDDERRRREAAERDRAARVDRVRDAGFDLSSLMPTPDPYSCGNPLIVPA